MLKSVGDVCGGYLSFEVAESLSIEWAHILVLAPKSASEEVLINDGFRDFRLQVWKEELLEIANLENGCNSRSHPTVIRKSRKFEGGFQRKFFGIPSGPNRRKGCILILAGRQR